ncbi:hypothetical protein [Muriicola soli]|uniref:Uncharacterized protein n=1 Tax=Muriicola soli TaxID=2507538 RepID=A0A411E7I8_9FLAO|nr:hypothetical protein [Muriicola soli]QBA63671.1 hypothetical protein EQY75_03380 [Muriicola soli]
MKKLTTTLALLFISLVYSQEDLIYFSTGDELKTNIFSIDDNYVSVRDKNTDSIISYDKDYIFMVKFQNGDKEVYGLKEHPLKFLKNRRKYKINLDVASFLVENKDDYSKKDTKLMEGEIIYFRIEVKNETDPYFENAYFFVDSTESIAAREDVFGLGGKQHRTNKFEIEKKEFDLLLGPGSAYFKVFLYNQVSSDSPLSIYEEKEVSVQLKETDKEIFLKISPYVKRHRALNNITGTSTEIDVSISTR